MYTTRIAPSPTGDLHFGTARTAYFNFLAARATGGKFILRIDDTDLVRSSAEFIDPIFETLKWLGLNPDEVYYQSQRTEIYNKYAQKLLDSDHARLVSGGAIALNIPDNLPDSWHDTVVGDVKITDKDREVISDLIIMRSDGTPTYHFATAVDDVDLGVNYVIRGSDHITNTAKHVALWTALGNDIPDMAHVGLIFYKKKKLSKREGAASMLHYMNAGYDPDAILNFMIRLGWGPTIDDKSTKMIDKTRAIELFFSGGSMRAAPSNMDLALLESFDRKYKAQKKIWRNRDNLLPKNS